MKNWVTLLALLVLPSLALVGCGSEEDSDHHHWEEEEGEKKHKKHKHHEDDEDDDMEREIYRDK
ncbi:MAG: hypothetical protein WC748_02875 [Legionellales bacterium]|jgi:hypothetical protein